MITIDIMKPQYDVLIRSAIGRTISRSNPTDAGWDLPIHIVHPPYGLAPGERFAVPTRIAIMPPPGVGFRIVGRSSTYYRHGLEVSESIVDPGYQGDLFVMLMNRTSREILLQDGQRLAQVIFFPIVQVTLKPVAEFPSTERGTKGLGSTGE